MWRAILIISQQNSAAEGKFKLIACDQEHPPNIEDKSRCH
jgi:hypothetical protein